MTDASVAAAGLSAQPEVALVEPARDSAIARLGRGLTPFTTTKAFAGSPAWAVACQEAMIDAACAGRVPVKDPLQQHRRLPEKTLECLKERVLADMKPGSRFPTREEIKKLKGGPKPKILEGKVELIHKKRLGHHPDVQLPDGSYPRFELWHGRVDLLQWHGWTPVEIPLSEPWTWVDRPVPSPSFSH
mmetsp:Transcript_31674/g.91768  ORF Transcript_31674/g.91768 Transcript_31674/m.91768 type:complete len:188 (+) Transcript_31674:231-794(+)